MIPNGTKWPKVVVRKATRGVHLYIARIVDNPVYGWGNTPAEARAKLIEQLARHAAEKEAS